MKRKIFLIATIVCLAALMISSATVAYFTDTKKSANVYTAGNVYIELTEAAVVSDASGNLIADLTKDRIQGTETGSVHDYGKIYPAQTIHKDPTIENTGDDDAWIAAKVTLSAAGGNLHRLIGYEGYNDVNIKMLLRGGLLDERVHVGNWNGFSDVCYNDRYAMVQTSNNLGEYTFYFFMKNPMKAGDKVTIFDTFKIPAEWNNSEIKELANFKITIEAFAVQKFGFDSSFNAMKGAFPNHFQFS